MRLHSISANNFKSLQNFTLPVSGFSCLVGLNGSGKSTVLQFFDFLSHVMHGDIDSWLSVRNWIPSELTFHGSKRMIIDFSAILYSESNERIEWKGFFNRQLLRCSQEKITVNDNVLLRVEDGRLNIHSEQTKVLSQQIAFDYQGSVLSQLKESQLPSKLVHIREFFRSFHALDMLSPAAMRQRTRNSAGTLGLGGEKLSSFLHEIGETKQKIILNHLRKVYPQLEDVSVKSLRSGWKQLFLKESYGRNSFMTEARHVSDGILRLLAVFSQLSADQTFLLLDEIENGVNPELIEALVDALVGSGIQIVVTTHSPLVLNFLEDEVAKDGVIYLHKNNEGITKAVKLFSLPSMQEKLKFMGPGEAYEDTNLQALSTEILQFQEGSV